jgi:hypothetical protein
VDRREAAVTLPPRDGDEALYLDGFVPPGTEPPPSALLGVAGRPVGLLDLGAVQAAVSSVPAQDYAPERMEERVRDLDWIGEQGALHERVVTWFVDHGEILPVRLLTLYSGAETLRASVPDAGALAERLKRLEGRREWDLKVSYDADALAASLGEVSADVARLDGEIEAAPPGRRYLLERKRARLAGEETSRAARRLADELHERLRAEAEDARRLPLPREKGELPVVLNAAYLVARTREGTLAGIAAAEVERLRRVGVEARLTGPWAAYRFVADPGTEGTEGTDGDGDGGGDGGDGEPAPRDRERPGAPGSRAGGAA